MPNKIPIAIHSGSNYEYNLIIKELANEFEGQFECFLGKHRNVKSFFCSNRKRN